MRFGPGVHRFVDQLLAGFAPPPELKPSEWAEANVRIPVGNAVPGLVRFDNAPYQREPLDMTADPDCYRITLMWGAQTGKTFLALCGQGYRIAQDPTSQMMMQPSQGDLQVWLETKFQPLVDSNPELEALIAKPRARKGVNNQLMKSYPGGFLMFAWSGSPKTARGRSAPFIVADEVDGYDRTTEGHPVSLLWKRATTFGDLRKLLEISTPTRKGASYIEDAYNAGDQRRFWVPCPCCGHMQTLKWSGVVWEKDEGGEPLPETAGYRCEGCAVVWTDVQRVAAIRSPDARWIGAKPFRGHASYHLSELYSCLTRLSQTVQSFLDNRAANDLQTFVNVSLAETWEEEGDSVDAAGLMGRVEDWGVDLPAGVVVLTAGIDMQPDRLEVEIVGWGIGEESWSIDYRVLWGDPLQPEVWEDLDDVLGETWRHASGAQLSIYAAALDTGGSGGTTTAAYGYAERRRGSRLFAIKGVGGWGRPIVSAPSRRKSGKRSRNVDLFPVGVDEAKLIVMRRAQISAPGPGFMHLPKERDPEWFAQLTAEVLRRRYVKGFPVLEWHKARDRNEAFDCRVYALAALKILNPNLGRLAQRLAVSPEADGEVLDAPAPPRPASGALSRAAQRAAALRGRDVSKSPEAPEPAPEDGGAAKGRRGRRGVRGRR